MRTTKTLALIGTLGLLAGAALAQPAPGDNDTQTRPPHHPTAGRPDPEMRRKMLTEKYDANKDGKLDDSELAALGRDVLEGKFGPPPSRGRGPDGQGGQGFNGGDRPPMARDQGGPGFDGGRPPRPRGEGQQGFRPEPGREGGFAPRPPMMDRGGDSDRGQFAPEPGGPNGPNRELARKAIETHRQELIKKYDTDGDGKLSASEREALGRDIEEGKLPPPPLPPQAPRAPREPQQPRPGE